MILIFSTLRGVGTTTGVDNLDRSIDLTNVWLKDIMDQLK